MQLGTDISSEPEVMRGILARFNVTGSNPPQDDQVVDIFTQLARLAVEGPVSCDVGTLVQVLSNQVSMSCLLSLCADTGD